MVEVGTGSLLHLPNEDDAQSNQRVILDLKEQHEIQGQVGEEKDSCHQICDPSHQRFCTAHLKETKLKPSPKAPRSDRLRERCSRV